MTGWPAVTCRVAPWRGRTACPRGRLLRGSGEAGAGELTGAGLGTPGKRQPLRSRARSPACVPRSSAPRSSRPASGPPPPSFFSSLGPRPAAGRVGFAPDPGCWLLRSPCAQTPARPHGLLLVLEAAGGVPHHRVLLRGRATQKHHPPVTNRVTEPSACVRPPRGSAFLTVPSSHPAYPQCRGALGEGRGAGADRRKTGSSCSNAGRGYRPQQGTHDVRQAWKRGDFADGPGR